MSCIDGALIRNLHTVPVNAGDGLWRAFEEGAWTTTNKLWCFRFDEAETISCRKGEALWHGRGGRVECRAQRAERDCNERSLLRRYGAGVKILTMVREEIYTAYREEVVEEVGVAVQGGAITLDGGVGGRVF